MNVESIVYKIINNLCDKDTVKITDDLQEDLLFDSLAMVMLLVEVEEEFNISLKESDMNPYLLKTVSDIVSLVKKYTSK